MIRSLTPFEESFDRNSGNAPIDWNDAGIQDSSPVEGGFNDRFSDLEELCKSGDVMIYRPL